eukprot:CAMPEP_0115450286 /NCGR_PEP_ID=MMETSP0271-20121206/41455_1 /TAXON_ID=71861 /ORGANISM="Scrippsiella trochoidea, Strain CCMP3099" /LENGTH=232 /DNA_ID=CAMNT_0002876487 /DNA_START=44 /DNA_END=742 /DNA_ORIENTATION=-
MTAVMPFVVGLCGFLAAHAAGGEAEPTTPLLAVQESSCSEEQEEGEPSCLLMRGASLGQAPLGKLLGGNATSDNLIWHFPACFKAVLRADPVTTPLSLEAARSHAIAWLKVTERQVYMSIDWKLPGVSKKNPVIGLHVHKVDPSMKDPTIVGFCGQAPKPSFTGRCAQRKIVRDYPVEGAVLEGTLEEAAHRLAWCKHPEKTFYAQLHTESSLARTGGLGLIRGQLQRVQCA